MDEKDVLDCEIKRLEQELNSILCSKNMHLGTQLDLQFQEKQFNEWIAVLKPKMLVIFGNMFRMKYDVHTRTRVNGIAYGLCDRQSKQFAPFLVMCLYRKRPDVSDSFTSVTVHVLHDSVAALEASFVSANSVDDVLPSELDDAKMLAFCSEADQSDLSFMKGEGECLSASLPTIKFKSGFLACLRGLLATKFISISCICREIRDQIEEEFSGDVASHSVRFEWRYPQNGKIFLYLRSDEDVNWNPIVMTIGPNAKSSELEVVLFVSTPEEWMQLLTAKTPQNLKPRAVWLSHRIDPTLDFAFHRCSITVSKSHTSTKERVAYTNGFIAYCIHCLHLAWRT
jgi:hypothetical protein